MTTATESKTLKTIRFLKLGTLVLFAALVLCVVVFNLDKLNGDDLRRLGSRISYGFGGELPEVSSIAFTEGESSAVTAFKDGICAVADDRIKVFDATGMELMNAQLVLDNPAIYVTARQILAYDRGASTVAVYNSFSELKRISFERGVIDASLSEAGALIVAHKSEGYRSQLTVYDGSWRERYKWYAADTYITAAAVYGTPTRFACAGVTMSGGDMYCEVITFDPAKEDPLARTRVEGNFVYELRHVDKNTVVCLTDLGYYIINVADGTVKNSGSFGQNTLGCYDISGQTLVFGFAGRSEQGYEVQTVLLSDGSKTTCSFASAPVSVVFSDGNAYAMVGGSVVKIHQDKQETLCDYSRSEYRLLAGKKTGLLALSRKEVRFIDT